MPETLTPVPDLVVVTDGGPQVVLVLTTSSFSNFKELFHELEKTKISTKFQTHFNGQADNIVNRSDCGAFVAAAAISQKGGAF